MLYQNAIDRLFFNFVIPLLELGETVGFDNPLAPFTHGGGILIVYPAIDPLLLHGRTVSEWHEFGVVLGIGEVEDGESESLSYRETYSLT